MSLELILIYCPHCPTSPITYTTIGELEAHFLECHSRPVPEAESLRRLAAEAGTIGRAPHPYDPALRACAHCGLPLALGVHASILCPQWVAREVQAGVITGRH